MTRTRTILTVLLTILFVTSTAIAPALTTATANADKPAKPAQIDAPYPPEWWTHCTCTWCNAQPAPIAATPTTETPHDQSGQTPIEPTEEPAPIDPTPTPAPITPPTIDPITPTCDPGQYQNPGPHPCPQTNRNGNNAPAPAPMPAPAPEPAQAQQNNRNH